MPGPYCVTSAATVEEVLEKIVHTRAHRVYIINEKNSPVGVISLGDIMGAVLTNL